MSVRKDEKRGTWLVKLHYTNHDGETIDSTKRGFKTKTEALAWERDFLANEARSTSMTFEQFVKVYAEDVRPRLRETTWRSKEYMINEKLIPFFGGMRVVDITSREVMDWQNALLKAKDKNGKKYSETYIRTVENQLSAILNHAVRHYGLPSNPLQKAGRVGEKQGNEMKFWTTEEYLKFSEQVVDRPEMFYAYEILYWCGLREGELLALTAKDIDTKNRTISVTKSYSRLNGRDIIGKPKTKKSERVIALPRFLAQELQEYMEMEWEPNEDERLFPFTKYALNNTLKTAAKLAGVKEIRVHDLRHSHVSLLINLGFTAVAIADRMGHESVHITYRYAHLFPNQQRNMADVLDALMNARAKAMSVKSLDREGRWRDTTVGFRVSEEENERINQLAALSGMTKQAFIINRLEGNEITVLATVRVQKALAIQAKRVADELSRISAGEGVNARLLDVSETILDVLAQMNEQGMVIDKHSDGVTLEEMETSDLSETMAPDMRQIPLTPEEVEPVADADARKPKRRRKSTKGMFKKERR